MISHDDDFSENDEDAVGGVVEPMRNRVSTAVARNPDQKQVECKQHLLYARHAQVE